MLSFAETIATLEADGYPNAQAAAKLAHDVILKAMEKCGFADHVAIKGGVVMGCITGDLRRATMDMDVDFVRYGLSDSDIDAWIARLNCLDGIRISRNGPIAELRQMNYRGRRIHLAVTDSAGVMLSTKLDIGVHVHESLRQRQMRFSVSFGEAAAVLPANRPEQMFAEKLKSLLRLGTRSTRAKDVFDMCYLAPRLDVAAVRRCVSLLVFDDPRMRERGFDAVANRLRGIFASEMFLRRLSDSRANWLQIPPKDAAARILAFLETL